jgi:hypothetical protein
MCDSVFIKHANMSKVFFIMLYSVFEIHATNFYIWIYKHAITAIACIIKPVAIREKRVKNTLQNTIDYLKRYVKNAIV